MSKVGFYVVRLSPTDRELTFYHKVESEIEDRAVTGCGRQMKRKTKEGELVFYQFLSWTQNNSGCSLGGCR